MTKLYIIAEIGVNHDGDLDKALKMIGAAYEAGADAVKFQLFDPEKLEPPGDARGLLDKLKLPRDWVKTLQRGAHSYKLDFLCTAFDSDSLRFLLDAGMPRIKIASGHLDHWELLDVAAASGLPILLSTGAATEREVRDAVEYVGRVTLLHCVSAYPPPADQANMLAMVRMARQWDDTPLPVGFSDHFVGVDRMIQAVTLGATVLERHITLDRYAYGPDHFASDEPEQFAQYVARARQALEALGDGFKRVTTCEEPYRKMMERRAAWRLQNSPS